MARAWHLISRPSGLATSENFELREVPDLPLRDGEVRVRNEWLSVDPAMRNRMGAGPSAGDAFALGEPMVGGAVGVVVESRHPDHGPGDPVNHLLGWRDEAVVPGPALRKLPVSEIPPRYYLHHMGVIGFTAYTGLLDIAHAAAGETVFVSAAGGAVGSAVVQIAKLKGMTVIGSAGGAAKCALVRGLGADAAIDYKAPGPMLDKLRNAAPDGIDVYFDNVGGAVLNTVLRNLAHGARIVISGAVSQYNATEVGPGPTNYMNLLVARASMTGFVIFDYQERYAEGRAQLAAWIAEGKIKPRTHLVEGIRNFPVALNQLFTGGNIGKFILRVAQA